VYCCVQNRRATLTPVDAHLDSDAGVTMPSLRLPFLPVVAACEGGSGSSTLIYGVAAAGVLAAGLAYFNSTKVSPHTGNDAFVTLSGSD
jgi:hypothetical protein